MNMENTLDLIDSELTRLNLVAGEILANAGVEEVHLLTGEYLDEWTTVESQRRILRNIQAKAKLAQMEFEAYERVKTV